MIELWRPIPGYELQYEVSNHGNVRSLNRWVHYSNGAKRVHKGQELKQSQDHKGYMVVGLSQNGEMKTRKVHRLVLLAFKGVPSEDVEACHNDGNRTNNHLGNLRWDTRSGNAGDRKLHGTNGEGSKNPNARLTEDEVRAIRIDQRPSTEIAKDYPVSRVMIRLIQKRARWAHVI